MTKPKIKIFVSHHKPWYIYEDDVFVPIQVWKKNSKVDLWILWDDTWDNISEKNDSYAELTAQYWVWKNYDLSDVDYVWFCHYRRYMTYCYRPNFFNYIFAKNFYSPLEWKKMRRLLAYREHNCLFKFDKKRIKRNSDSIKDFINGTNYDMYFVKSYPFIKGNLRNLLWIKHKDLVAFWNFWSEPNKLSKECIKLFLEEYLEQSSIVWKLARQERLRQGVRRHLFIMKKDLFMQYVERLFNYLFKLEKLIEDKNLDISMHRAGKKDGRFMWIFSEPLINYWLEAYKKNNDLKISYKANILMFTDYYL